MYVFLLWKLNYKPETWRETNHEEVTDGGFVWMCTSLFIMFVCLCFRAETSGIMQPVGGKEIELIPHSAVFPP